MMKIFITGNVTADVVLQHKENDTTPYAIMRVASNRPYKTKDGIRPTDYISVKFRGQLAERCAQYARKGTKVAACGSFETIEFGGEPNRQPGFLVKGYDLEILSPKPDKAEPPAEPVEDAA